MSWLTRLTNVFRGERVNYEIDEEIQSHIEEAVENGRDRQEVLRAFGSTLRKREESRDVKLAAWLDSLRSDTVFGIRQLRKNRTATGAAVLSLALAIGACGSAFRLIDALLLQAAAGVCSRETVLHDLRDHGSGWEVRYGGRLRVSGVPVAADGSERPGRADGDFVQQPDRLDLRFGRGDGEGAPAVCVGMDFRRARAEAGLGPSTDGKRRRETWRASCGGPVLRLLEAPVREGPEGGGAFRTVGQGHAAKSSACWKRALPGQRPER